MDESAFFNDIRSRIPKMENEMKVDCPGNVKYYPETDPKILPAVIAAGTLSLVCMLYASL